MKIEKPIAKIAAGALCVLLAAAPICGQERMPGQKWQLKYQAGGAPFYTNEQVNVVIGKEGIVILARGERELNINASDVTQIKHETGRGRYAARALADKVAEEPSPSDLVLSLAVVLPVSIVTLPFRGTRHFVTIEWTEGRQHRAVVLRMKGNSAREFLLEVAQATGVTPRDLDHEREEFRKEQKLKQQLKAPVEESQRINKP